MEMAQKLLNSCSLVGGTVWEGLGNVALLEEVSLGLGFEVSKAHKPFPNTFPLLVLVDQM